MHSFFLTLTKTDSRLALLLGGKVVAEKSWAESRDMGRQLFEGIDALLSENGLKPGDIGDFQLQTEVSDNFTSVKIAETVAKVYTWAVRKLVTRLSEAKTDKKESKSDPRLR